MDDIFIDIYVRSFKIENMKKYNNPKKSIKTTKEEGIGYKFGLKRC